MNLQWPGLWHYRKNTHDSIIAGHWPPEVVNAMRKRCLSLTHSGRLGRISGFSRASTGFADVGDKVYDRGRDALDERKA